MLLLRFVARAESVSRSWVDILGVADIVLFHQDAVAASISYPI